MRVKVATAEPSSAFHILADPSVDVEARNSESRLEYDRQTKAYNSATRIDKKKPFIAPSDSSIKPPKTGLVCIYFFKSTFHDSKVVVLTSI